MKSKEEIAEQLKEYIQHLDKSIDALLPIMQNMLPASRDELRNIWMELDKTACDIDHLFQRALSTSADSFISEKPSNTIQTLSGICNKIVVGQGSSLGNCISCGCLVAPPVFRPSMHNCPTCKILIEYK